MRQLTVILFADIAGYTSLMQDDEALAIITARKFRTTLEDRTALHGGHVNQWSGDGALCSFGSAVEAVYAAMEIQKLMREEPIVPLRIGIHAGDVLIKENDLFGDGVNIASRIESFAVPGSIFISKTIYDDIKNHRAIETVSLGKFQLKNVSEPLELFAISNNGLVLPLRRSLKGKGLAVSKKKTWLLFLTSIMVLLFSAWFFSRLMSNSKPAFNSIAVLPFVDMSANKDQEYFGDGLSEELLAHLTKVPGLKVIARTSSFSFKGKNEDLRSIGAKLGVTNILAGSVRKFGNKIRITAQLNNTKDGTHIWSETYERKLDDIFKIQDEISSAVVQHLQSTLLKGPSFAAEHEDPGAYNLMLQARFLSGLGNEDSTEKATQLYKKGLTIDPNNARLWAHLSQAYTLLAGSDHLGKAEGILKAKQSVEKSLSLNPGLYEAYISRGRIRELYDWDWAGANEDYQKAFDLNPHDAVVLHRKASLERSLGNFDKAIFLYGKAIEIDPLSAGTYNSFAITLMNANLLDEAVKQCRKILELRPKFTGCHALLSSIYLLQGKKNDAYIEVNREVDEGWKLTTVAMMYNVPDRRTEANAALQKLITGYQDDWAYQIAQVFAWNGDTDKAFFWLERAYNTRDGGLAELKGNPFFKGLQKDPRYFNFMKKIGLA